MRHKTPKLLSDVLEAATAIRGWTASRTPEEYRNDSMLRAAVERNFEIIGEALNRLSRVDAATAERLGPYERIIAFRNILIHGYDIVEHERVWQVVANDLPDLIKNVERLLDQAR